MADHASLVFLSYNRPQFIFEAIHDAVSKAGYPCEVIVHDDGSTDSNLIAELVNLLGRHEISRLILNPPGHNEGVGTAINRGFKLATGDPVIKLDQDLLFTEGWLARVVGILRQDEAIGMLGLFKYSHEPVPWERMQINVPTQGGYHYTRQFCGSAFANPRQRYQELGPLQEHSDAFAEDMEYMERVRHHGWELALPDVDLVRNRGFGIGPSTVVEQGMKVHEIHHGPLIVGAGLQTPPTPGAEGLQAGTDPGRQFDVGVVITTCAGREANLKRTVENLMLLNSPGWPKAIVVVYDGCPPMGFHTPIPIHGVEIPKHEPGMEQPRNVGVRKLREIAPDCNYVWFLDSDLIFQPDILEQFYEGLCAAEEDRILIGPYDWLAQGVTESGLPATDRRVALPDYRWVSFNRYGPEEVLIGDLGAALACFGGNLVWPVDAFQRVGGFHPELHHGRCEDGELGLRAASAGIPMSFVRTARAWHVWHPVDGDRARRANARDVPLLNSWHPWVEQKGLIVTTQDGARFDFRCPECGEQVNSLEYWPHTEQHER